MFRVSEAVQMVKVIVPSLMIYVQFQDPHGGRGEPPANDCSLIYTHVATHTINRDC